jgi:hypothetical protein
MQISFKLWLLYSKETVPGTHSTGTRAGHRAGLDDVEEIIISRLLSQIEPQFLGQPAVTVTNALSHLQYTIGIGGLKGL